MKYAFIQAHRKEHKILRMCQVLGVSSSGYYDWSARPISHTAKTNRRLLTKIRCYHQASFERYGAPRIHQDLLASGEKDKSSTCRATDAGCRDPIQDDQAFCSHHRF